MKSPSEITTIDNESSTKLSSAIDQISNSSITNNNTEHLSMKSPTENTTITNESSPNFLLLPIQFPTLQLQIMILNKYA